MCWASAACRPGLVRVHLRQGAGERHQAVERPAVEQMPPDPARHRAADGALARAARAVDGDDGTGGPWLQCPSGGGQPQAGRARERGEAGKAGGDVGDVAGPASGARARRAGDREGHGDAMIAAAVDGAAGEVSAPRIHSPSVSSWCSTPSVSSPAATAASRSLSLTRSSRAPRTSVSPCAQAAAMKNTGNSSIDERYQRLGHGDATQQAAVHLDVGGRLGIGTGAPCSCTRMSAPMRRSSSSRPVRVGLTPTLREQQRPLGGEAGGHDEERRRGEVRRAPPPRAALRVCPPSIATRAPLAPQRAPKAPSMRSV